MANKIIFFLVFNFFSLSTHATINISKPIAISLGWNCEVAVQLRQFGLRTEAFPLDWLGIPYAESIISIFQHNFAHFLDPRYLQPECGMIINTYYKINFVHDFPTKENPQLTGTEEFPSTGGTAIVPNYLNALSNIKNKYNRRILRLRNVLKSKALIIFIRTNTKPEEAKNIVYMLKKYYPKAQFLLIVLHRDEQYKQDWNLPQIKSFYANTFHETYGNVGWFSNETWHNIFISLGLIK